MTPGPTSHLDNRRLLQPRDYLADPFRFGRPNAKLVLPDDGDEPSMFVARIQHVLVARWVAADRVPSPGELRSRYGVSKQTWSRCITGERWAGGAVLAALCETFFPAGPGRS